MLDSAIRYQDIRDEAQMTPHHTTSVNLRLPHDCPSTAPTTAPRLPLYFTNKLANRVEKQVLQYIEYVFYSVGDIVGKIQGQS